jgi:GNAT superfamily N-acetyltransferase
MTSTVPIEGELAALPDGAELLVRQVQPTDKRLLAAGFEQLSPESRYRRFFAPIQRLSERDLAYLTELDHRDHEALAAIHPDTGELVGVARYVRGAEPHLAEVSVVVGDPWQRRGVATLLMERLVECARAAGVTHFVALVMSENSEALRVFEHRLPGPAAPRRSKSGHLEFLIELPEPGQLPHSTLGRLLRAAARRALIVNPYRVMRDAVRRFHRD